MIKYFLIFFIALFSIPLFAQSGSPNQFHYNVKLIPLTLLTNANVVKRMEEIRLDIKDSGKAVFHQKYALTILNSAGDRYASFEDWADKFFIIKYLDATLFDSTGRKIKSLKRSEIQDLSGTGEESLITDSRIKLHNFHWKVYPYTVEYEITKDLNGIFFLPDWKPTKAYNYSVDSSILIVKCPKGYKLRYKESKLPKGVSVIKDDLTTTYFWSVKNQPALEYEKYSTPLSSLIPIVYLAPYSFSIQNYSGYMDSWKTYGSFMYQLNKDRDQLPDIIKRKVHSLTDSLHSVKEKVNVLYQYLQKNTRYISIQLGIGGWQTFDANYVSGKGYGDCKALSNYMYSLLKEIGIPSDFALIRAGYNETPIVSDFSSTQFNHVILCVPQPKDSIWLECTSAYLPSGYLSGFTSNRYCLLYNKNGGKLVRTPFYNKSMNTQIRKIISKIDSDGNLYANLLTRYKAEQEDNLHNKINYLTKDKIEEYLKEKLDLPSYDLLNYNYTEEKVILPIMTEKLELKINSFAQFTNKRLFFDPNILNRSYSKIPNPETRKFDFLMGQAWTDIDSVEINIPKGYISESVPRNYKLQTPFGSYSTQIEISPEKIIYIRKAQRNSGTFPAGDAKAISAFFDSIFIADREKIVMVRK